MSNTQSESSHGWARIKHGNSEINKREARQARMDN